jgi:hypothetical protein
MHTHSDLKCWPYTVDFFHLFIQSLYVYLQVNKIVEALAAGLIEQYIIRLLSGTIQNMSQQVDGPSAIEESELDVGLSLPVPDVKAKRVREKSCMKF